MRTAGLTMNDVWADRVVREQGVKTYRYERQRAEIGVLVESVDLKHRSRDENYRPYLHMTGELRWISPANPLPYGISRVTYSPGQSEKVDAFYEFDDEQLVVLVSKGYFSKSFVVPEDISGIEWELPAEVDVLVLAPSPLDTDVPVVFTHVHEIGSLEIDLESCRYDLTEYFADHSRDAISHTAGVVDEHALRARSDAINPLFTDSELDVGVTAEQARVTSAPQEPVDDLSMRLLQMEAHIEAEAEQWRTERERTKGTPENLYHEHVVASLTERETEEPAPHPWEPHTAVPPGLVDPAQVNATAAKRPTMEELKREVAQRASDLDFGEPDEHGLGPTVPGQ